MDEVVWVPIPRFEKSHVVSNHGDLKSIERYVRHPRGGLKLLPERVLKQHPTVGGYLQAYLSWEGESTQSMTHRVVLEAFVGPCPPGLECRHKDGNKLNNRLDNLEWVTHAVNMADKFAHGTVRRGEQSGASKLTEAIVREIRASDLTQPELAVKYGVCLGTISHVKTRKTWKHVV